MTPQEKREAIRQACIKANPEIVELRFGCRINIKKKNAGDWRAGKRKDGFGTIVQSFVGGATSWSGYDKANDNVSAVLDSGSIRPQFSLSKNQVEIIGRPIRLADVLSTFTNEEQTDWTTDAALDIPGKWNLRKDDLIDQDDSTIDFIYDLIKEI